MSGDLHLRGEAISKGGLHDLKKWQHLQDLLSQTIKANISLFDGVGNYLTKPSQVTGFCADFVRPVAPHVKPEIRCVMHAFQHFQLHESERIYTCPHKLRFANSKIKRGDKTAFVIVIGPILIGSRPNNDICRAHCKELGIDPEIFCDRIREIPLFSHQGLQIVTEFTEYLHQYLRLDESVEEKPSLESQP
ncbi:MAG: PocR ligand-binding domain-containing protein [Candidatus Omnitrophica bacterium]|nr:PocR ligand-binding domain-containing protein [Candidatus Omnitrophota bacterium]